MILANLKQAYRKKRVEELMGQIYKLLEPFDQNRIIKELIREIEDVQILLMAILLTDSKLPKITLIEQ